MSRANSEHDRCAEEILTDPRVPVDYRGGSEPLSSADARGSKGIHWVEQHFVPPDRCLEVCLKGGR